MNTKSSITIQHEGTTAPAGNILQKHPDNISGGCWRRITVVSLQSGQPRPYADSIYESDICFEGGCRSTIKGYDINHGTKPFEDHVRSIARLLVRPFEDQPTSWASAQLVSIVCIEEGETYSIWRVKIVEPYTD
jgi:hypothetical protein